MRVGRIALSVFVAVVTAAAFWPAAVNAALAHDSDADHYFSGCMTGAFYSASLFHAPARNLTHTIRTARFIAALPGFASVRGGLMRFSAFPAFLREADTATCDCASPALFHGVLIV